MVTCELLGLDVWQLGALCGLQRREMHWMLKLDRIPVAVCLHFKMLENWFYEVKLKRKVDGTVIPAHFVGQQEKIQELWAKKDDYNNGGTRKKRQVLSWSRARSMSTGRFSKTVKTEAP